MRRPVSEEIKRERAYERKKFLLSLIFPAILTALIGVGVWFIMNFQAVEEETESVVPNSYEGESTPYIIENDKLKLTFDPITTQISVEVKATGKIWYSNPQDIDTDTIAQKEDQGKLKSPIIMTYGTETGLETVYDAFSYSIEKGIYEVETGEDFVKVNYSIGNVEKTYVIPPVTTVEKFEGWLALMEKKNADIVKQYYKKYDINNLGKKDDPEELLAKYPILETEVIYALRDGTKENVKKTLQKHFENAGYTYDDYLVDSEYDFSVKTTDALVFNVAIEYRLDDDELVVSVPFNDMQYPKATWIYELNVLPYFGAGNKQTEGFIMVPEGGGAIMNFNNGKSMQNYYQSQLYSYDRCVTKDAVVHNTCANYNAFGISDLSNSFICTVEDGVSYASVRADVSGRTHSYNYVTPIYRICEREKYDVGQIANVDVYEYLWELPKDEVLEQRYRFVSGGSYIDMAMEYKEYLKEKLGDAFAFEGKTEVPVAVDVIGAVDKVRQIVGIPVSRPLELTSYKEAEQIINELYEAGLKNMSVKLEGWCNGGVNQSLLKKVKTVRALGSKADLNSLSSAANNLGIDLYLNGVTAYEYDSDIFDGFFSYRDAAKLISKQRAELCVFSAVTYSAREGVDTYYLLHTELASKMIENLAQAASSYKANVSFEDVGSELSSDYYRKNTYSREAVRKVQMDKLEEIKNAGQKVMINLGNDYAFKYADFITNMDLVGSDYTILDQNVPFLQLAIHGYIDYTGNPLNICGNLEDELLASAEYGAGLQFSVMKDIAFTLQNTLYTKYYGCDYDNWKDRIVSIYSRYNSELGTTFNQEMVNHEKLTPEVSCTMYADGTKVYVNYSYVDYNADGVVIPARDYKVVH